MIAIFLTVLPIFALIAAGFGFARIRGLGRDAVGYLTAFVIWLALPALLFRAMAEARFVDVWQPGFLLSFGAGMVVAFAIGIATGGPGLTRRGIDGLTAGYANATFLGIPVAVALVGQATGLAAAILATLLTVVVLFAVTVGMAEYDRHRGGRLGPTLARVVASTLRNPLVLAPLAGGVWGALRLPMPVPLHVFADMLGSTASPCALVTIGMSLAQREETGAAPAGRVAWLVSVKLLLQPAVTAAIAFGLLTMPRDWAMAAVLIAAQPTGTGPFMLASLYGQEARLASRVILISTVLSIVSVTVVATLLR
ncbi:AEC family transporter [Sphingomonas sp. ID0503]|uniref:AEC family transporter n=1 Tax=Sphingomonas sp. ID0503 TaxID=3399691 RepID=UPI003AFAC16E